MPQPDPKPLWTADEIAAVLETHLRHPWNPEPDIYIALRSMGAGLKRAVHSNACVPPGKESSALVSRTMHQNDQFQSLCTPKHWLLSPASASMEERTNRPRCSR